MQEQSKNCFIRYFINLASALNVKTIEIQTVLFHMYKEKAKFITAKFVGNKIKQNRKKLSRSKVAYDKKMQPVMTDIYGNINKIKNSLVSLGIEKTRHIPIERSVQIQAQKYGGVKLVNEVTTFLLMPNTSPTALQAMQTMEDLHSSRQFKKITKMNTTKTVHWLKRKI